MKQLQFICVLLFGLLVIASDEATSDEKKEIPKAIPKPQPKVNVVRVLGEAAGDVMGKIFPNHFKMEEDKKAAAEVDEDKAKQVEQQFPQLRALYWMEIHYMKEICDPGKEELRKILQDGEIEFKGLVKNFARFMPDQRGVFLAGVGGAAARNSFNPRHTLTDGLIKSVQARLSPERAARYEEEIRERRAAERHTNRIGLVAAIDKALMLSGEQRTQIEKILDENWDESWQVTLFAMYGGQYLPQLPDKKILPVLTEPQRKIYSGVQKLNFAANPQFAIQNIRPGAWAPIDPDGNENEDAKPARARPVFKTFDKN